MSWEPAPRPDWVRAINAGEVAPVSDEADRPFERDQLLAEAAARVGADDFGDDGFLEPLDRLLASLETEAALTLTGRWLARRFLLRLLEVRLHIAAYMRDDPGVRDEPVVEPLFVTGAPRTGTTILHGLLAQDPASRAPEGWELLRPVPPPDPATYEHDPRIPLADQELRLPSHVVPGMVAIHEYRGRMYKECLSAMSFEFRSEEFTTRYRVPTYERWLQTCDMRPAYESHRLVLQILQRRWPPARWALKSPVHLHSLTTLLAVYPDARLAVTHRDPLTVLGSLTSLAATMRWAHSDHVDLAELGRDHAERWTATLDGLVTLTERGRLDPDRTHHGHYAEFLDDPLGAVAKAYAGTGLELTRDAAEAMASYLAANPQGRHGAHTYSLDGLGFDVDEVRAGLARYRDYFSVPAEA